MAKKPMRDIVFPLFPAIVKPNGKDPLSNEDVKMLTENFDSGSENDFDVICNVVYDLPVEFNRITEVTKGEDNELVEVIIKHKRLCYFVINSNCIYEDKAIIQRPDLGMKQHLKPLFIWAKVENVGVNKYLVDGGVAINLMSHSLLKKISKYGTDLKPHNMVLSNYDGKMSYSLGVI